MAKPKTPPKADQLEPAAPGAQEGAGDDSTSAEGDADQLVTLGRSSGIAGAMFGAPAALGALPPSTSEPAIPPEIDAELNPRERRMVWLMVNGSSYEQAWRKTAPSSGNPGSRAKPNDEIPPAVLSAVSACLRQIAASAGLNRQWLIAQTVALYARAAQAEPVLDRRGRPTGTYRFDGTTAAKCLDMLAQWEGSLYPKKGPSTPAGELADLLRMVAERRASAPAMAAPRLIGASSAAPQQTVNSLPDQGPLSDASSVIS